MYKTIILLVILININGNILTSTPLFYHQTVNTTAQKVISIIQEINDDQTNIYELRIYVAQMTLTSLTWKNSTKIINGQISMASPIFNGHAIQKTNFMLLQTSFTIVYKDSTGNSYRILITKASLTYISKTPISSYYEGLYSKRFQIFYHKNNSNMPRLYSQMEDTNPLYLNASVTQTSAVNYMFALNQSIHITLFPNGNQLRIRQMLSFSQIRYTFSTYTTTINLPNTGYSCSCLNTLQTRLYILDLSRNLIEIDLFTNLIVKIKSTTIYMDDKCFYTSNGTSKYLVFLQQDYNVYTPNIHTIYYNLLTEIQTSSPDANVDFSCVSQSQRFISAIDQNGTYLYSIPNLYECPYSKYYNSLTSKCDDCASNCFFCSNLTTCQSCMNGYYVDAGGRCSSCPLGNFYNSTTSQCLNCSSNCAKCLSVNSCYQCEFGYDLSSVFICQRNNLTLPSPSPLPLPTPPPQTTESAINQAQNAPISFDLAVQVLLNNSFAQLITRIPSSRQLFPVFFYYFGNFDDIWLYQYHERDYGQTVNALFDSISNLENFKWQMLDVYKRRAVEDFMGFNQTNFQQKIDRKQNYSEPKFIHYESKGENLLSNCYYYLTLNLVFVVLTFLIMNLLFKLLFNYKVSKLIRPFSFWGYIGLIMMDGNLQIVFFLMFSQDKLLFSLDFSDKVQNFLSNIVFFLFLWFSVASYFMYYSLYKKLAKYFLGNSKCGISGILSLVICNTFRQLLCSAIHNFCRHEYKLQILSLLSVQVLNIAVIICFSLYKRTFKELHVMWTTIVFSFVRILFNISLYLQQHFIEDEALTELFQGLFQLLIVTYILIYLLTILINVILGVISGVKSLCKQIKPKAILSGNEHNEKKHQQNIDNKSIYKSLKKTPQQSKEKDKLEVQARDRRQKKKTKVQQEIINEKIAKIQQHLKIPGYDVRIKDFTTLSQEKQVKKTKQKSHVIFKKTKQVDQQFIKKNGQIMCVMTPSFTRTNKANQHQEF